MATFKEGDRVRVVTRKVTEEDRKKNRYFEHMAGAIGTVQNVYGKEEVAIKVDRETMSKITISVHDQATQRMRERFLGAISEEHKKQLTAEELNFDTNYNLLVHSEDLEKIK